MSQGSPDNQCGVHFLMEFSVLGLASSYAHSPSDFVSTLRMALSQGLSQTKLVSMINLFTIRTVPGTRIFQVHLTRLSFMYGPVLLLPVGSNNQVVAQ